MESLRFFPTLSRSKARRSGNYYLHLGGCLREEKTKEQVSWRRMRGRVDGKQTTSGEQYLETTASQTP